LNEINNFIIKLEENLDGDRLNALKILPLHSALSDSQNEQIFNEYWPGENIERKIIVSTNIAESSITVPDVGNSFFNLFFFFFFFFEIFAL
jgi:HrpA-like RNA helicase